MKTKNMDFKQCSVLAGTRRALLGTSNETVKTLWTRIRERSNMGDTVLGTCHRPDQEGEGEEAFIQRLEQNS